MKISGLDDYPESAGSLVQAPEAPKKNVLAAKKTSKKAPVKNAQLAESSKAKAAPKKNNAGGAKNPNYAATGDRYRQVSMEYDNDYNKEKGVNKYHEADESNIYNKFEDKDIGTPLDG